MRLVDGRILKVVMSQALHLETNQNDVMVLQLSLDFLGMKRTEHRGPEYTVNE